MENDINGKDRYKLGVIAFVMFLPARELLQMLCYSVSSIRVNGEDTAHGYYSPWGPKAEILRENLIEHQRPRTDWGLADSTILAASVGAGPILDMTW